MPVALQEDTVQGLVQKHDANRDAVCAVQFMDGKAGFDESAIEGAGVSAPKMRQGAEKLGGNTRNTGFVGLYSQK
jgi:hypothetical protein